MERFPGSQDEVHSGQVLVAYLLESEKYKQAREALPYAL